MCGEAAGWRTVTWRVRGHSPRHCWALCGSQSAPICKHNTSYPDCQQWGVRCYLWPPALPVEAEVAGVLDGVPEAVHPLALCAAMASCWLTCRPASRLSLVATSSLCFWSAWSLLVSDRVRKFAFAMPKFSFLTKNIAICLGVGEARVDGFLPDLCREGWIGKVTKDKQLSQP